VSRLIVISNRVTVADTKAASTGGLAVGILAALRESGGIWCGWSGELSEQPGDSFKRFHAGQIDYATLDLKPADYQGYYNGFSNSVLWPLFHFRIDLMNFARDSYDAYRRVNVRFAQAIKELLRPGDVGARLPSHPARRGAARLGRHAAHRILSPHALPAAPTGLLPALPRGAHARLHRL
jgi:trehalose 6-phosphate synthase